ncbi:serine/threonine phosphatase [Candidatus Magnetoovum chiemensis]|nr:serine/threonine phosphatase [Candidatus Magnetoovum chiemensis]
MSNYKIVSSGQTDKGLKRPKNEDNFCVEDKDGLFIVCDGVGGSASGEVASKMAIDVIRDYIKTPKKEDLKKKLKDNKYSLETNLIGEAVNVANNTIYGTASSNAKLKGMSTTVAAFLIRENRLSIAHVGDSRVYLIRSNSMEQLTDDHSLVAEQMRLGLISKEEARHAEIKNVITRSLGYYPEVEVDLDELSLRDKDIVLACTDGLHTMVSENTILHTVLSTKNPQDACTRLIDFANKKGGRDNITVVIVYVYKKKWFSFVLNIFNK